MNKCVIDFAFGIANSAEYPDAIRLQIDRGHHTAIAMLMRDDSCLAGRQFARLIPAYRASHNPRAQALRAHEKHNARAGPLLR